MSKMIVFLCVVWISGNRADGGVTKCMFHESQVKYNTIKECHADIPESKNLIRLKLRQDFGDRPEDIIIQITCTNGV
jgi:hypothetical protein